MNTGKLFFYIALLLTCFSRPIFATELEKLVMPGELVQSHAKFEAKCEKCHKSFNKIGQNKLCMSCHDHANIKKDIAKGTGYHGRIKNIANVECNTCHTDHRGRGASIVSLIPGTFNHDKTDFRLKGKHTGLECKTCHKPGSEYHEADKQCVACHKKVEPHKGKLGKQCGSCHAEKRWNIIRYDHTKHTKFKLRGKHKKVNCDVCHINNKYKKTPKNCYACHYVNDIHNGKQGKKCGSCHSEKSWKNVKFDHKKTKFPLKWNHLDLSCVSCHVAGSYEKKLKTSCVSCHKQDDTHKGRYGKKCSACHTEKAWKSVTFRHNRDTKFRLKGLHKKLACDDCHRSSLKDLKKKGQCYNCHKSTDVHKGKQGRNCGQCHTEEGWNKKLAFDHGLTAFPLMGQHAVLVCEECHVDKEFKNTTAECSACHKKDDVHSRKFGGRCGLCHNPNDWKLWAFDHTRQTDFILDGAHEDLACSHCHTRSSDLDVVVSKTCEGCHRNDDVHRGGFGRACQRCHITSSFSEDISY